MQKGSTDRLTAPWSRSDRPIPRRVIQPLHAFMHMEVSAGLVLVVAAVAALVWANSPAGHLYDELFETPIGFRIGEFQLVEDLRHWVNDLLMALFFFVVGLEIKREFVLGELADPRAAALPVIAAVGGMAVPALLYLGFNAGGPGSSGWGIPMATDIAFALGVLALVGRRAPAGLKVFLLTLAIADDLGAILVIALFYSGGIEGGWLAAAAAAVLATLALRTIGVRSLLPYVCLAALLWLAVLEAGIHATVAGVLLGLLTPARPLYVPDLVGDVVRGEVALMAAPAMTVEEEEQRLLEVSRIAREAVSPLARLEGSLHAWSAYLVLPLFALANAGVDVSAGALAAAFTQPVTLGVIAGLLVGKPVGVVLASWVAVRTGLSRLPRGVGWLEMIGAGLLAGIGFTVALFIANLAFTEPASIDAAKVGIMAASLVAALLGAGFLAARDAAAHADSGASSDRG